MFKDLKLEIHSYIQKNMDRSFKAKLTSLEAMQLCSIIAQFIEEREKTNKNNNDDTDSRKFREDLKNL